MPKYSICITKNFTHNASLKFSRDFLSTYITALINKEKVKYYLIVHVCTILIQYFLCIGGVYYSVSLYFTIFGHHFSTKLTH